MYVLLTALVALQLTVVSTQNLTQETTALGKEDEFFLKYIFDKYGNKGVLTFEGLEHLMESLGLGGLEFKKHNVSLHKTQDGGFQEVHHQLNIHNHNHTLRKRSIAVPEQRCLRPEELLKLYGMQPDHGVQISKVGFLHICPAIVYQLDNKLCSIGLSASSHSSGYVKDYKAWMYGVISVLVMSVCGLFGAFLVPVFDKSVFQKVLSVLASLAVGTLSGDALLHLLPHALQNKDGGEEGVVLRAGMTYFTVMCFFVLEAVIHSRKKNKVQAKEGQEASEDPLSGEKNKVNQATIAWMVITGDGLHNLTDGLAVGAAFSQDPIAGLATSVAVLFHELPHELGDFAILLKTGMNIRKVICYNILSSVLSLIGVIGGLWLGEYTQASLYIYAATAGSFLYISLVTLIPEMHKTAHSVPDFLLQLTGMFFGGAIMFLIAIYEHTLYDILRGEHGEHM